MVSDKPTRERDSEPPVVVVGLPRSGSSYLSYALSTLADWYVIDDLYIYQESKASGADGPLTVDQRDCLLGYLAKRTKKQNMLRPGSDDRVLYHPFQDGDVDAMVEEMKSTFEGMGVTWHELTREWIQRLALSLGRGRWGYKTPQDFWHMRELREYWPGVRFVFLVRDPRDVMASYKYVRGSDGDPRQYHPLVYARYWKAAYDVFSRYAMDYPGEIQAVQFEELTRDPDLTLSKIATFLESRPVGSLPSRKPNSSFSGRERRWITPTEMWLCEWMAGETMTSAGYEIGKGRFRLRDLPELVFITARFGVYQVVRLLGSRRARVKARAFLRGLFKAKGGSG